MDASNDVSAIPLGWYAFMMILLVGIAALAGRLDVSRQSNTERQERERYIQGLREAEYGNVVFLSLMKRTEKSLSDSKILDSEEVREAENIGEFVRRENKRGVSLFQIMRITEQLYGSSIFKSKSPFTALSVYVPMALLRDENIGVLLQIAKSKEWNDFIVKGENIETVKSILDGRTTEVELSSGEINKLPPEKVASLRTTLIYIAIVQFLGFSLFLMMGWAEKLKNRSKFLWRRPAGCVLLFFAFPGALPLMVLMCVIKLRGRLKERKRVKAIVQTTSTDLARSGAQSRELLEKLERRMDGGAR